MAAERIVVFPLTVGDSANTRRQLELSTDAAGDELLASAIRDGLAHMAIPLDSRELAGVRELVSRYVVALHDRGVPPERVITSVKQLAREAGLHASANQTLGESSWTDEDRVLADLVRWCIAQYFEAPAREACVPIRETRPDTR